MPRADLKAMLVAAVTLGGASPASAQATDGPAPAPNFEAALEALGHDMNWREPLGKRLSTCLRPLYPDSPEHADIVLAIEIDAEGTPGAPYLLDPSPDEATLAHLRQLFRAEAAIFDCAPLTSDSGDPLPAVISLRAGHDTLLPLDDAALADQVPPPAATAETERALALDRNARREIQVRLRLAGHDPGGADGVFGPRTRAALSGWQEATGQPVSGYLNEAQRDRLVGETEAAYAEWQESRPARTAQQPQRAQYYRGADGCLRDRYGRRVGGQSLRCDLRGLFNQF